MSESGQSPASVQSKPEAAPEAPRPIITLTTDFGEGYYAGAVKGAILDICPQANIIDISHNVTPHDVLEGAFMLLCTYPYYPAGSVHVAVVDPGVGTERRGLIVSNGKSFFVGPDNGVFSFIYDRESSLRVIAIEESRFLGSQVSPTFHGRDVFGPVAAWLARGMEMDEFGEEVEDFAAGGVLPAEAVGMSLIEGIVMYVDRFGNVITSLRPQDCLRLLGRQGQAHFFINEQRIDRHYDYYAQGTGGELFSLVGSSGYYEIAAHRDSAARILGVERGAKVELELDEE